METRPHKLVRKTLQQEKLRQARSRASQALERAHRMGLQATEAWDRARERQNKAEATEIQAQNARARLKSE